MLGRVSACSVRASAGRDETLELPLLEHGRGLFRDTRRPHVLHRAVRELALLHQPPEEALEPAVAVGRRGRSPPRYNRSPRLRRLAAAMARSVAAEAA